MDNTAKKELDTKTSYPRGVEIIPLITHFDERGDLTEIFRQHNVPDIAPRQWNLVHSNPHCLRGVHVHLLHTDYLVLASGHCAYGLYDCRKGSPTEGLSCILEAEGKSPYALVVPPGVAHGFYFYEASCHIYAVDEYWNPKDELGCRFDDPQLGLNWPSMNVLLSPKDKVLPSLASLLPFIPPYVSY